MNALALWIPGTALLLAGILLLALGKVELETTLAFIVPGAALESLGVLLWSRQRRPSAERNVTSGTAMNYQHTQTGWPIRASMLGGALALAATAVLVPEPTALRPVLLIAAVVMFCSGWVFGSLRIQVDWDHLHWHFGTGWPRRSIAIASVTGVETTHTRFWEGWGIHRTRRGWLYNVSGYDAVLIRCLDGSTLLLGTDEPRRLKDAIDHARTGRRSS